MHTDFPTPAPGHTPSHACDQIASACGGGGEGWDWLDKPPSQTIATLGSSVVFSCKRSSQLGLLMVYTTLLRAGQGHLSIQPLPNTACSTTPTVCGKG